MQAVIASTERGSAQIRLGRREAVAMVVGSLLYFGLSWTTNVFHMQAASDLQIRPAVAVPIFFGFVYGPLVGFVVGALGNILADMASGLLPYPSAIPMGNPIIDLLRAYLVNWQVGNGLMGLIPGIAALYYRRYFTLKDQIRALSFVALGILVGIGYAAFLHPLVDPAVDFNAALTQYFLPVVRVNLANAVVLVPILLYNYERTDLRSLEWMRSGLMRQLLVAILVSAALPVGLLGLFLTEQAAGAASSQSELFAKLAFTLLISLLFTLANAGLVAQSMSRPLLRLAKAARSMEKDTLSRQEAATLQSCEGSDEISRLSQVFGRMALEVMGREARLREQVEQLRIEIDETKRAREVADITDTDFFRDLQEKARRMRGRRVEEG